MNTLRKGNTTQALGPPEHSMCAPTGAGVISGSDPSDVGDWN